MAPPARWSRSFAQGWLAWLIVVAIGALFTWLAHGAATRAERRETRAAFELVASERQTAIRRTVSRQADALHALGSAFDQGSVTEERARFTRLSRALLERHTGIQALEWIPRVAREEREGYESANDTIHEQDTRGRRRRAGVREEYFPVQFIEPFTGNEAAQNFDLGSNRIRREALERAAESGTISASARVRLVQETGRQYGALVFFPRKGGDGFFLCVLRVQSVLDTAVSGQGSSLASVTLTDESAEPGERDLAVHGPPPTTALGLRRRSTMELGDREWAITVRPTAEFVAAHRSTRPTWVLVAGFLFSLLLAAYIKQLIAERRLATKGREAATARSTALVSANPDSLVRLGDDLHIRELHLGDEEHSVFSEDHVGQALSEILPAEVVAEFARATERASRTGELQELGYPLLGPLGPRTYEARIAASTGGEVVATIRDVTDREAAREAGLEGEARWRALVASCEDHIVACDLERRVVFENRAFSRTRKEALQSPITTYFAEADREPLESALRAVLENGESSRVELTDAEGARNFDARLGPVIRDGRILGATLIASDITERKEAAARHAETEQHLLRSQKLESLGVLAGGIAHDFNNLLTAIMGNASMVELELGEAHPSQESVSAVISAAERAAHLTAQLLAYAGRGHVQVMTLNLSEQVREMTGVLGAASQGVEVRLELDDGAILIEADLAQLQQVVVNLTINAVEAAEGAGGHVAVRTGTRVVDDDEAGDFLPGPLAPGPYAYLEVVDTGAGMDEATRARLFDPFFTTKSHGRGLGLAALLGIVRTHGGGVRCTSELGRGTEFVVCFPLSEKKPAPAEPVRAKSVAGAGTVMVIDDQRIVLETARASLEHQGYSVICVDSGRKAIERYAEHGDELACIVLDITMPGLGGIETRAELRELDREIPIVLSSGYHEGEAGRLVRSDVHTSFLQKPYSAKGLGRAVADAISKAEECAANPASPFDV